MRAKQKKTATAERKSSRSPESAAVPLAGAHRQPRHQPMARPGCRQQPGEAEAGWRWPGVVATGFDPPASARTPARSLSRITAQLPNPICGLACSPAPASLAFLLTPPLPSPGIDQEVLSEPRNQQRRHQGTRPAQAFAAGHEPTTKPKFKVNGGQGAEAPDEPCPIARRWRPPAAWPRRRSWSPTPPGVMAVKLEPESGEGGIRSHPERFATPPWWPWPAAPAIPPPGFAPASILSSQRQHPPVFRSLDIRSRRASRSTWGDSTCWIKANVKRNPPPQ